MMMYSDELNIFIIASNNAEDKNIAFRLKKYLNELENPSKNIHIFNPPPGSNISLDLIEKCYKTDLIIAILSIDFHDYFLTKPPINKRLVEIFAIVKKNKVIGIKGRDCNLPQVIRDRGFEIFPDINTPVISKNWKSPDQPFAIASKKINTYVKSIIEQKRIEVKVEKLKQLFDSLVHQANNALESKNWSVATSYYQEALILHKDAIDNYNQGLTNNPQRLLSGLKQSYNQGYKHNSNSRNSIEQIIYEPLTANRAPLSHIIDMPNIIGQKDFEEKYEFDPNQPLHRGFRSHVFKAISLDDNTIVAIKRAEAATSQDEQRYSVQNEFGRLKSIPPHDNIVKVINSYTIRNAHGTFDYGVMEFIGDGKNLYKLLNEIDNVKKPDTIVNSILIDILRGLSHLHRYNLAHRHLRPSNILIKETNKGITPIIIDFRISKLHDTKNQSEISAIFSGGEEFLAPEVIDPHKNSRKLAAKLSDIWSFGIIAYFCFLRVSPLGECTDMRAYFSKLNSIKRSGLPLEVNYIPPPFQEIVKKCLKVNPKDRYQNVYEIITKIQSYESNPNGENPKNKEEKTNKNNPVINTFSIIGMVSLLLLAIVILYNDKIHMKISDTNVSEITIREPDYKPVKETPNDHRYSLHWTNGKYCLIQSGDTMNFLQLTPSSNESLKHLYTDYKGEFDVGLVLKSAKNNKYGVINAKRPSITEKPFEYNFKEIRDKDNNLVTTLLISGKDTVHLENRN